MGLLERPAGEMGLLDRTIMDESMRPPSHPDGVAAAAADAAPVSWVLLEHRAFVAHHPNGTTAKGSTRTGQPIEVTFWTAPPPCVSYFCAHCPGLEPTAFAAEPKIIATDADLVLIRVCLGSRDDYFDSELHDYFIYKATPTPSLKLIPHPCGHRIYSDRDAGLLRCGSPDDGSYIIAVLSQPAEQDYVIHIYRSITGCWTSHPLSIQVGPWPSSIHVSTKVITVGGRAGTMGWVDLCNGILFCDLLLGDPGQLRFLPLPPSLNVSEFSYNMHTGYPKTVRDIAVVQSRIKYSEVQVRVRPGSNIKGTYISEDWMVATWSMAATNPCEEDWHLDCKLSASEISLDSSNTMHFHLLPKLQDDQGTPQQTLQRLHTAHPTLSLHNDDIVYLMAKVDHSDHNAWVLAVDMRSKTLKDVAEFGAQRTLGISFAYIQCRISEYLPPIVSADSLL